MTRVDVARLREIAEIEFAEIVYVSTFPRHFHDGDEMNVVESHLGDEPSVALREFLTFIKGRIKPAE